MEEGTESRRNRDLGRRHSERADIIVLGRADRNRFGSGLNRNAVKRVTAVRFRRQRNGCARYGFGDVRRQRSVGNLIGGNAHAVGLGLGRSGISVVGLLFSAATGTAAARTSE